MRFNRHAHEIIKLKTLGLFAFLCLSFISLATIAYSAAPLPPPFAGLCPDNIGFDFEPACIPCSATVVATETAEWLTPGIGDNAGTTPRLALHLTSEFTAMKVWMTSIFWEDNLLPALMLMSEQLSAVAMQQASIIGQFLDAKQQLETQQVFQELQARAHKDYHPSIGVCEFGSGAKSLAASERKAELNELVLSKRSQDRSLGNANTNAAVGDSGDKESRIKQFREKFCDPADNNNGLSYLCEWDQTQKLTGNIGASDKKRENKDIDFVRTVDSPWTLDVDFTNTTLTDNEEEIMALANNLYGHEVFIRPPSKSLQTQSGVRISNMQKLYLDMRSVLAKRSVAENSFNAITAMKTSGAPGSHDYLVELVKQLGVPAADVDKLLGPNPSYNAQMEVLTKKIFQNPDFYTNLYDTPANVDRKGVAIQAIALMQKFDLYKSYLRNEANLSVLLELSVQDLQDEVENQINDLQGEGTKASH